MEASSEEARVVVERRTRGVEVLDLIFPHYEEHTCIGEEASFAGHVASVFAELAQAAAALPKADEDRVDGGLQAGVTFARVALTAINLIPRINPNLSDQSWLESKAHLLELIDEDVEEWIEESGLWDEAWSGFWLQATTALLFDAANGATALEGWSRPIDGEDAPPYAEEPFDPDQIREAISDSLLQAAELATAAVQWFEEHAAPC